MKRFRVNVNTGRVLVLFGCSAFWAGMFGLAGQTVGTYAFTAACIILFVLLIVGLIQERNAERAEANEVLSASIKLERLKAQIAKAKAQKKRHSHLQAEAAALMAQILRGA